MLEASETLHLENDSGTLGWQRKWSTMRLMNGWDYKVGGFYDEGFYFKDSGYIAFSGIQRIGGRRRKLNSRC
jgi:mannobiose 2-epimerase